MKETKKKDKKYREGYKNGLSHAMYHVKDMEEAKDKYFSLGKVKLPMPPETNDLFRMVCYNIRLQIEKIIENNMCPDTCRDCGEIVKSEQAPELREQYYIWSLPNDMAKGVRSEDDHLFYPKRYNKEIADWWIEKIEKSRQEALEEQRTRIVGEIKEYRHICTDLHCHAREILSEVLYLPQLKANHDEK